MRKTIFFTLLSTALLAFSSGCGGSGPAGDGDATEGALEGDRTDVIAGGGKFEITELDDGRFVFSLKARNNRSVLSSSERYESKANAVKGVQSVLRNIAFDSRLVLDDAHNSFILKARNGEPIAKSEQYADASNRTRAIEAIRRLVTTRPPVEEGVTPPTGGLAFSEPMAELVPALTASGEYRIRLIDVDRKILLRSPGSKTYAQGEELDDTFFAIQAVGDERRTGEGIFPSIVVRRGEGGYYFNVVRAGTEEILATSPKTDYESRERALEAARHVADLLEIMPRG